MEVARAFSVPRMEELRRRREIRGLGMCVRMPFPALADVARSHGEAVAVRLVRMYVIGLNDSCNQQRMTAEQIAELAELLYEEGSGLKITEMFEFFREVKKGAYGECFGSLDGLKVMVFFRRFMQERERLVRRAEALLRRTAGVAPARGAAWAPVPERLGAFSPSRRDGDGKNDAAPQGVPGYSEGGY